MPTPKSKVKKVEEESFEIVKEAEFSFVYYENVERIGLAFAQAGRFVKIRKENNAFFLDLYIYKTSINQKKS